MCPYNQGIFIQPYGIPIHIKGPVIYCRYETGGMTGGSCWGNEAYHYNEIPPENRMQVLDIILKELLPKISYLQYKQIERLIHNNTETDCEYYGNSTEWMIEYIILSELEKLIEEFKNE